MEKITKGAPIVVTESVSNYDLKNILRMFERDEVYRATDVEVVQKETLLPLEYIERGFVPSVYQPHMINGIRTTNHDTMGSDRFVVVKGEKLSAVWFRPATAAEVNRHARSIL